MLTPGCRLPGRATLSSEGCTGPGSSIRPDCRSSRAIQQSGAGGAAAAARSLRQRIVRTIQRSCGSRATVSDRNAISFSTWSGRSSINLRRFVPPRRRCSHDEALPRAGPDRMKALVLVVVELDRASLVFRASAETYVQTSGSPARSQRNSRRGLTEWRGLDCRV